MSLFDDLLTYDLCFPGAVTGSTEVECPHSEELLAVHVDGPMGKTHSSAASVATGLMVDRPRG